MKRALRYIFIVFLCSVFLISCDGKEKTAHILFDFESDTALDQLHWKCHVLYSLSDDHAVHGKKSLKMELFVSAYPGFSPELRKEDRNWSGYDFFSFHVFNPSETTIRLVLRIDDQKDALNYSDRYNRGFQIVPGHNKIIIDLDELKTSGSDRVMNLKYIHRLMAFMSHPDKPHTVYLDYFLLSKRGAQ